MNSIGMGGIYSDRSPAPAVKLTRDPRVGLDPYLSDIVIRKRKQEIVTSRKAIQLRDWKLFQRNLRTQESEVPDSLRSFLNKPGRATFSIRHFEHS